jgi:hypothetical protein
MVGWESHMTEDHSAERRATARTGRGFVIAFALLALAGVSSPGYFMSLVVFAAALLVLAYELYPWLAHAARAVTKPLRESVKAVSKWLRSSSAYQRLLKHTFPRVARMRLAANDPTKLVGEVRRDYPIIGVACRFVVWLVVVGLTLAGLAILATIASGLMGWALESRTKPITLEALYVGAIVTGAIFVGALTLLIKALGRIVFRQTWRGKTVALSTGVVFLVVLVALSLRDVPNAIDVSATAPPSATAKHDILVVLDPGDDGAQTLARHARRHRWTFARARGDTVREDVAFGVAVPAKPKAVTRTDEWSFIEPPTTHRQHFVDSVADLPEKGAALAPGAYASLLSSLRASPAMEWRSGARRTVALVLDRLPSGRELDSVSARVAAVIGTDRPADRGVSGWPDLVSMGFDDRETRPLPERYARLVVATQDRDPARLLEWKDYVTKIGGRLLPFDRITPEFLHDLEDAATGTPVTALRDLAEQYAPHLRFDSDEQFLPVDVDRFLAEDDEGGHRACDREGIEPDCHPISGYADLSREDEFIDFAGGARLGRDLFDRDNRLKLPRRIYVHLTETDGRLHFGYWWFLRYNVSPWQSRRNCLPGLTLGETTCFDHEGDWEGVTVTLAGGAGAGARTRYDPTEWHPITMTFAAHAANVRWRWDQIEREGGRAGHPVVYIALGSHAAYPARCDDDCNQRLAGKDLPEGRFDGDLDWGHDETACCIPLPVTPEGTGAAWNAFRGRWGTARCIMLAKICSQSEGPRSPSFQARFKDPDGTTFAGQGEVLDGYRAVYSAPP